MISVIIPTYNEERNIGRCLRSLLNQSVPRDEYEIIVVDGGSTDRTVEIAEKYADKVVMQRSKGVGGARNDGVREARGDVVAMTDADTYIPPHWIERIKRNFDGGAVLAYGPIIPMEEVIRYRLAIELFNKFAYILHTLNLYHPTVGANTAFRRREFLIAGGYPPLPAYDDYDITGKFIRMQLGKIVYDRKMWVGFSTRRMKKWGVWGTASIWLVNAFQGKRGRRARVEYARQRYDV